MNWLTAILQSLLTALSSALIKPRTPEPPAPLPSAPRFRDIAADEDKRLDDLRDSLAPVTPRELAVDRAEDAGAMVDSEAAPTVRKP